MFVAYNTRNYMYTQDINCLQWIDRYITAKFIKNDLTWEEELSENDKKTLMVFDVGMNKGDASILYFDYFATFDVVVHGFEPNKFIPLHPRLARFSGQLVENRVAVSDTLGTQILYVPTKHDEEHSCSALSSLVNRPVFSTWGDVQVVKQLTETVTLDEYCKNKKIKEIDYLKIDVEGFEYNVLQGAKILLSQGLISAGQFEYGGAFADNNTTIHDIILFLSKLNYSCFLGPVEENNKLTFENAVKIMTRSPDQWENILFIRNDLL